MILAWSFRIRHAFRFWAVIALASTSQQQRLAIADLLFRIIQMVLRSDIRFTMEGRYVKKALKEED